MVASVFAFTILSAGSSSTEKGKQAIQAGLEGVQSSMNIKGSVVAQAASSTVDTVTFTVSLVAGGSPVNLADGTGATGKKEVVIGYKDQAQFVNDVKWTVKWIVTKQASIATADNMLEEGELAEITVDLTTTTGKLKSALGANTAFNLEIKPPKGAVLNINRTTPSAIQPVMDLN